MVCHPHTGNKTENRILPKVPNFGDFQQARAKLLLSQRFVGMHGSAGANALPDAAFPDTFQVNSRTQHQQVRVVDKSIKSSATMHSLVEIGNRSNE